MELSGLIIETSIVHSTKSARPLSIVKFVFLCDNDCTHILSQKLSQDGFLCSHSLPEAFREKI